MTFTQVYFSTSEVVGQIYVLSTFCIVYFAHFVLFTGSANIAAASCGDPTLLDGMHYLFIASDC